MPSRLMRYTPGTVTRLDQNVDHQFVAIHALSLYKRNAVLSYIPKKGCTTPREYRPLYRSFRAGCAVAVAVGHGAFEAGL
jgi:hypothetical protein